MDVTLLALVGLVAIIVAALLEPRLTIAAPLLLVATGIVWSFIPGVPTVNVPPEVILTLILPPLLYSTAVSMPTMDFRREVRSISLLSVLLVVFSSLILGLVFWYLIDGISFAWGVALGAIVSPTDAVATKIVRSAGVSHRIVTVLEGESLLNDASALVLLRAAVAAAAGTFSVWGSLGTFLMSVSVAIVVGVLVGKAHLWVRHRVADPTIGTAISFIVPFAAAIPVEHLGASGLVAAVAAGLVTGQGAGRALSASDRVADAVNWRTIELIAEGAIFAIMGLELRAVVADVGPGAGYTATWLALLTLAVVLVVRGGFLAILLAFLSRRVARRSRFRPRADAVVEQLDDPARAGQVMAYLESQSGRRQPPTPERVRQRLVRFTSDLDYFLQEPLGPREWSVLTWAGMRGVVTVAAAQTLPVDTPNRSLVLLVAFLVAILSLFGQSLTLPAVVRIVRPAMAAPPDPEELGRVLTLLRDTGVRVKAEQAPQDHSSDRSMHLRLEIIAAQRSALLDARDEGTFSSATLTRAMSILDADQLSLERRV